MACAACRGTGPCPPPRRRRGLSGRSSAPSCSLPSAPASLRCPNRPLHPGGGGPWDANSGQYAAAFARPWRGRANATTRPRGSAGSVQRLPGDGERGPSGQGRGARLGGSGGVHDVDAVVGGVAQGGTVDRRAGEIHLAEVGQRQYAVAVWRLRDDLGRGARQAALGLAGGLGPAAGGVLEYQLVLVRAEI